MNAAKLMELGVPYGEAVTSAIKAIKAANAAARAKGPGEAVPDIQEAILAIIGNPEAYVNDAVFGEFANTLITEKADSRHEPRQEPVPYKIFGEGLEDEAVNQLVNACRLPVSVCGALMPDAHAGYGLPIGGVLAVENAVIPYAVGVDIACRMKLTVIDMPASAIETERDLLAKALQNETAFGVGASFKKGRRSHGVMDEDWGFTKVTKQFKDKAASQLGTSGSGNHFVEYGVLTVTDPSLGLEAGEYLAILSHSGSRGTGSEVASFYSRIAMNKRKHLPKELSRLAWLDMDSEEGQEYWQAMHLMGRYAAANHELIHSHIASALGAEKLLDVENHHNFAWKESVDGKDVVVHRKGATPASESTLGIIPGSMATPGFVVRGKGNRSSLSSASHGAGRLMSRTRAKELFTWTEADAYLKQHKVELLSAGLDEVPMAYKDIEKVMAAQTELVSVLATFAPRMVKMAPGDERAED